MRSLHSSTMSLCVIASLMRLTFSAQGKTSNLSQTLTSANEQLGFGQTKAKVLAQEIIELYGSGSPVSAKAQLLYGTAEADYSGIITQLEGDIAARAKKPAPIDFTKSQSDLNAFSSYAESEVTSWVNKNQAAAISKASTTQARIKFNASVTGSSVTNALGDAASAASQVNPITNIGDIAIKAVTSIMDEISKFNTQTRVDEKAFLETTRWLDWSTIVDPKAAPAPAAPGNDKNPPQKPSKDPSH